MQSTRLVQVVSTKHNKMLLATPKPSPICRFSAASGDGNDTFKDTYNEVEDDDAMTQGVDTQGETGDPKQDEDEDNVMSTKEDNHYIHPKTKYFSSSKLQTPGVNTPLDPHVQQKRAKSTKTNNEHDLSLCCAGLDGSPWPDDESSSNTKEEDVKEGEDNNKEYFKHHQASPVSKIEIADTRKPLTKVMHGTSGSYFGDEKVIGWKPEQLDTAEDSLRRATEMFREAAANGVPDWPHSRRLRQLLGEEV